MKGSTIEQVVMATAPKQTPNREFTNRVMGRIMATASAKPKRTSIFAMFNHMPKLALAIVAVIVALTLSGTAYAVYNALWSKPEVHSQSTQQNQFGRTEVVASFTDCTNQKGQAHYEIKKGATVTPEDVPKLLQAACERAAIEAALPDSDTGKSTMQATNITDGSVAPWTHLTTAAHVTSVDDQHIAFTGDVNAPASPLALDAETKYIVDGVQAKRTDIKPGDTVMFQTVVQIKYTVTKHANGTSASGVPTGATKVNYVVKLDLPYQYYNPAMQNQIVERKACQGNPADTCIDGAQVDLYSGDVINTPALDARRIEGVIQSHSASGIVIKTSSGKIITVNLPRDVIADYNNTRSAIYGLTAKVGDSVSVNYAMEDKSQPTGNAIPANHVAMVGLQLDLINKNDPIRSY